VEDVQEEAVKDLAKADVQDAARDARERKTMKTKMLKLQSF
jgi:hypothetical protein